MGIYDTRLVFHGFQQLITTLMSCILDFRLLLCCECCIVLLANAVLFSCFDFSLQRLYWVPFMTYNMEALALHILFVDFFLCMYKFFGFLNSLPWCLCFDHIVGYCYLWGSSSVDYFCEHVLSVRILSVYCCKKTGICLSPLPLYTLCHSFILTTLDTVSQAWMLGHLFINH